ncbi:BTB and MATH domain-containing protein 36 [Exaiptasia diaphana]|nr:BTB and MATH domain-containing protein 36 [Exaiptasia diaphana]
MSQYVNVKKQKLEFAFSSPWHFSDVILVVEEQKFHVHKSTLSMWSSMFERMFTSDFKEKSSQEIPLPGKKAAEVKVLLTIIYDREASVNV